MEEKVDPGIELIPLIKKETKEGRKLIKDLIKDKREGTRNL